MTLKQYKFYRLAIIILLSMSISVSISFKNYYLPIVFTLSAAAVMYYCRKQLKTEQVLADERDRQIAGDASRYTIFTYAWIGAIGIFILMTLSNGEGFLYLLSQYLGYSVCFLMLLNAVLFRYLSKKENHYEK